MANMICDIFPLRKTCSLFRLNEIDIGQNKMKQFLIPYLTSADDEDIIGSSQRDAVKKRFL